MFFPEAWEKYPASLGADGTVLWKVGLRVDLTCDLTFLMFPFDTQYCKVIIQSPHYGLGELNYTVADPKRAVVYFVPTENALWNLEGQGVRYSYIVPGVIYFLKLKRKSLYYIWTIAIPVICVCLLTGSTFVIPSDGDEKMGTVINALLSFFLLYLLFVNALPASSQSIPMLMEYIGFHICKSNVMFESKCLHLF